MSFQVGLSADLANPSGGFSWGEIGIHNLSPLPWQFIEDCGKNFTPQSVKGFDAIAFAGPGVVPGSFADPSDSPLIIARFGVGYDNIDLNECTRAGVALTITPDGSKKPVATAALTLTLATMHRLNAKMKLASRGDWGARLSNGLGAGLNGKNVGVIGLGNIGSEFFRLISPFECNRFAYDPWKSESEAASINVQLVALEELLSICDVVVILAALTPDTRHMINGDRLSLMKSNALLINVSRGAIIDEVALIHALQENVIAGAGLDVFENEPTTAENPLFAMENVVATPHNIAWTDELALGMGTSAFNAIKSMSSGIIPPYVVNKEVLETDQFRSKLARFIK